MVAVGLLAALGAAAPAAQAGPATTAGPQDDSATGPSGSGVPTVTQDTADVPGRAERDDHFGRSVHLADAHHDALADLAVGAPGENGDAGSVWTFRSGPTTVGTPNATTVFGHSVLGTTGTTGTNARLGLGFAY
ncbi:FG-GAP repeat protein [Streptomyces sp. DH24]|uniref:FG-GAP repeat protein n=1 Tax=Streptomyces sp. DH24 TaxID=3040123 RepID=UPI0024415302|nr:FG-GAP repeat protein [Streptomyces sp. DH24]